VRAPSQASSDGADRFFSIPLPYPNSRGRRSGPGRGAGLLPGLLPLAALVACNCRPDGPAAPPRDSAQGVVTVSVAPAASAQAAGGAAVADETAPRGGPYSVGMRLIERQGDLELSIQYPELSAPGAEPRQVAAAKALSSTIAGLMQKRSDEFAGYAEESRKGIAKGLPAWSLGLKCELTLNSPALISMACGEDSYTGGAHGNELTAGHSYQLVKEQWRELALESLFVKPEKARLRISELVVESLRKDGAQYVAEGTMKDVRAELKNFVLGPDGLRFFFSPYSVGPYVQGQFTALVPYRELAPFLPPRSVLEPLLTGPAPPSPTSAQTR
jgi:peptidoglycan-N-acetylglucosamine deacetylase